MLYFVVGYIAILFAVALYKSFAVKNQEDFTVAGRKVSTFFLVGTLVCTWIGSGSLFGGAGLAFRNGVSELWMSAGAWVGIIIVYFLVPKVHKLKQFTVSDILEQRYNATARLLGTITIIIAYMTIAGYQFRGGGRLLNALLGIDPIVGAWYTMLVTVLFTLLAGMLSIVALDIFNGIIMTLGVLLAFGVLIWQAGGVSDITANLPNTHLTVFGENDFSWAMGVFFPTFFLLIGESSMYQKFFSAKSEKSARNAVIGMVFGVVILETVLNLVAVIGRSLYNADPNYMKVLADGKIEYIKPASETIILNLAVDKLPWVVGGLLMAAAVAIILSTANTFLMVASTNITHDLYHRFIAPKSRQQFLILLQRLLIVLLGLVALVVATQFKSILDMAFCSYTMVGAGITPALLAALLWKRATPKAGAMSIGMGMLTTIFFVIIHEAIQKKLAWWDFDYIIYPAAIASIVSLIFVSLITTDPDKKYLRFVGTTSVPSDNKRNKTYEPKYRRHKKIEQAESDNTSK